MRPAARFTLAALLISAGGIAVGQPATADSADLARRISQDQRLDAVVERAKSVMADGFNAGDGYGEVWIRDFATFMTLACDVYPRDAVRERLLMFFRFQGEDGNIIDGYIPRDRANVAYEYIESASASGYLGHKNTVETDQEGSLVIGVARYVEATGDRSILAKEVDGVPVRERLDRALRYPREHRMAEDYGLLWGATTADWGDVQPEHEWGVVLDEDSHRAIDIYDNAIYLLAIDALLGLDALDAAVQEEWKAVHTEIAGNTRKHLWDEERTKFIPHIYLEGSPFPDDFDESEIYYHGGTIVAIEAGLLNDAEVAASLAMMRDNMKRSGAASIGLTLYPPYPRGFFKNPSMARPYSYQNGGDWTWFGARLIPPLVERNLVEDAYRELEPMIERVLKHEGFYEWYSRHNKPRGSGTFRGSAGVLYDAIHALRAWAEVSTGE